MYAAKFFIRSSIRKVVYNADMHDNVSKSKRKENVAANMMCGRGKRHSVIGTMMECNNVLYCIVLL